MVTRKQERALRSRIESLEMDVRSMRDEHRMALDILQKVFDQGVIEEPLRTQAEVLLMMSDVTVRMMEDPLA